jgi:hypothetical protein
LYPAARFPCTRTSPKCVDAGMDGFLGKPLDLAKLRDALLECPTLAA